VAYLWNPKISEKASHGGDDAMMDDEDDEEAIAEEEKPDKNDFLIEFARDFVAQAKGTRRSDILAGAKPFLERVHVAEEKKLTQALEKMGVDWSAGLTTGPADSDLRLTLSVATKVDGKAGDGKASKDVKDKDAKDNGKDRKIAAGDTVKVVGVVKNFGTKPAFRVRAVLQSDNGVFDENEMVFGKIGAGESKSYDLVVKVPTSSLTRTDIIKGTVFSQRAGKASPAELTLDIEGKARPRFAYSYQTVDDVKGNKDGLVQRGEQVRALVTVKNIGIGRALHTEASLRNGAGQEGILISAGRFDAKEMAPGESKTFSFVYEVGQAFRGDEYQLELAVSDTILGESVTDKIKIKVAPTGPIPEAASGVLTVAKDKAALRESAGDSGLIVGRATKGAGFKITGKSGAFTRVEIDSNRSAFVSTADGAPGGTVHPEFAPAWQVTPPVLTVTAPTVVMGDTAHLKGIAVDDRSVRDVYIRVWNRDAKVPIKKVFYLANRPTGDRTKLEFETDIPLSPGSNLVQVFARESNEVQTVDTVVILRKVGGIVAQPASAAVESGNKVH